MQRVLPRGRKKLDFRFGRKEEGCGKKRRVGKEERRGGKREKEGRRKRGRESGGDCCELESQESPNMTFCSELLVR